MKNIIQFYSFGALFVFDTDFHKHIIMNNKKHNLSFDNK